MFDKLISFILEFKDHSLPFYVVSENEAAVHLRLGKIINTVNSGLFWKIPFIDTIWKQSTSIRSYMQLQDIITKDGISCKIGITILYRIESVKTVYLTFKDAYDQCVDELISKVIKKIAVECECSNILLVNASEYLLSDIKNIANNYGILIVSGDITNVQFNGVERFYMRFFPILERLVTALEKTNGKDRPSKSSK